VPTLVIGLGNKGGEYRHTRHNVGWMVLDELLRRGRFGRERKEGPARVAEGTLDGFEVILARPQTYMNLSGRAANHLTTRFGIPVHDVLAVHDEVDLPLGRVQLKRGGRSAGNRGVESLIASWRNPDFLRLRVGVGRPPAGEDTADHVLDGFDREERPVMEAAIKRAADGVMLLLRDGEERAMNEINRRGRGDGGPEGPEPAG
jgi:peptidyl-tRNA hydrolase, PTH1 family